MSRLLTAALVVGVAATALTAAAGLAVVGAVTAHNPDTTPACPGQTITPAVSPAWASIPAAGAPPAVAAALHRPGTALRAAPAAPSAAGPGGRVDADAVTVGELPPANYGGVRLSTAQLHWARIITVMAARMGLTERAARIGLAVAMQESRFDPAAVNEDFVGLFQQRPDPGSGLYTQYPVTDGNGAAFMFLDQLRSRVPGYDTDPRQDWQIGEIVQESHVAQNVQQWQPTAAALAAALWPTATAATGQIEPAAATTQAAGAGSTNVAAWCGWSADTAVARTGGARAGWDPGNIISDAVFYDTHMTVEQVRAFIDRQDADCRAGNPWCLKNLRVSTPAVPADQYCRAYPGGTNQDAATVLTQLSRACGVNVQVMLVTLEKESQGLTRQNPDAGSYRAAFGFDCPDTGPGGSANCGGRSGGFFPQAYGMAHLWAKYRVLIPQGKLLQYMPGHTVDILFNVQESGCGSAPVTIKNLATASLYTYTPYQPNTAALTAYPGEGDGCSTYGNRNFFRLFQKYFGDTGGGIPPAGTDTNTGPAPLAAEPGPGGTTTGGGLGVVTVSYTGNTLTIPTNPHVPATMSGRPVIAPTPQVALAIADAMTWLGTPYSWGGGQDDGSGPSLGICGPDGAENDCHIVGFDCSGLTQYLAAHFGVHISHLSYDQRDPAHAIPWDQAQPGDIVGYDGHVSIYLGTYDGTRMQLEAPNSGSYIQITPVGNAETPDIVVYRYWAANPV